MTMIIDPAIGNQVFDILLSYNQQKEDDRSDFLFHFGTTTEYRFCGTLGLGGKFWNINGRLWVSCYPEDETTERLETIKWINRDLGGIEVGK